MVADDVRGACFDGFHGIGDAVLICTLPAEHKGAHRSDDGAQWSLAQGGSTARKERAATEFDAKYRRCETHDRARYSCGCYRAPDAARPAHADAVMADLGAAITEGVTEVRLLDLLVSIYEGARDNSWQEAADLAELVSGDPWNDVDPIRFRTWLSERLR